MDYTAPDSEKQGAQWAGKRRIFIFEGCSALNYQEKRCLFSGKLLEYRLLRGVAQFG